MSIIFPNLTDIIFVIVLIFVLAAGSQMLCLDNDLGRHLTIGNHILDKHIIPRVLFSHKREIMLFITFVSTAIMPFLLPNASVE